MSKRLTKGLALLLGIFLMIGIVGSIALAAKKELTPLEFYNLSKKDKLKYRTVEIKPGFEYCYVIREIPKMSEQIQTGDLNIPYEMYSRTLFSMIHPKVKFAKGVFSWDPKVITPALAAGTITTPFPIGVAGGPQAWWELGALADITDLVKNWDQNEYLWKTAPTAWSAMWVDGHCVGVLDPKLAAYGMLYRKDWFREAGIFDPEGNPGPPSENWTWDDLRKIAVKITDVKKKRWGYGYGPRNPYGGADNSIYIMSYSFGVLEPWSFTAPDKSGKSTWKFTVTPQLVETYQYLHDLMFKYKCMLAPIDSNDAWNPVEKDFFGGRVGIAKCDIPGHAMKKSVFPSFVNPKHRFEEDVGVALLPVGEKTGLRPSVLFCDMAGFPAYLTKEQLKLAFEFFDWRWIGRGMTLWLMQMKDEMDVLGKSRYKAYAVAANVYKVRNIPKGFPKVEDMIPEEYLKVYRKAKLIPRKPQPMDFGLKIGTWASPPEEMPYVEAINQLVVSKKDIDIEAELNKTADMVNKELTYKVKGDKEKFQKYYAAVEDFFKKTYPKFYESEMFKKMWEKYYKVF